MNFRPRILASSNVYGLDLSYQKSSEFWDFLLMADLHIDNPKSDLNLIKKHLDESLERNAGIIIVGDLFCAMQGKYDKRAYKEDLRPEHRTNTYFDTIVSWVADFLRPYKSNIILISDGNHETAIKRNHEIDLIERLIKELDDNIIHAPYGWYLRLLISRKELGDRRSLLIKGFHGYGGGGAVTKGVIQSKRQAVIYPDADIVVSGHVHEQYSIEFTKEKVTSSGEIMLKDQTHIRLSTYKEEFNQDKGGWFVETGKGPRTLGGEWLRVYIDTKNSRHINYINWRAK